MGIYGPTIGVVIGSLLHLIIQFPLVIQLGYQYQLMLGLNHKGVRSLFKLMLPRTFALAVNQIELTIAVFLASFMSAGSLSIFYFAQHLQALPVGLFGLTIGQAALPMLAKESDNLLGLGRFKELFLSSFKQILYFVLPASVLLLVLRVPLVRIAFGSKNFPWGATLLTGQVVAVFSLSIAAQAVIQLLIRAFYALQDTKTPLKVGAISVFVSVLSSLVLTQYLNMGVVGLGLGISLAGLLQAVLLFIVLNHKIGGFDFFEYSLPIIKMFIATILTGIFLWLPMQFLDKFILDTTRTIQLIMLTIVASGVGLMVYLGLSKLLEIQEFDRVIEILNKFGAWKKIFTETEEVLSNASATPTLQSEE